MDKQEDKKWEEFLDRIMGEAPLESPSKDFTATLLQKIETEAAKEVYQYKPLLSKPVLVGVFIAFAALMAFVVLKFGGQSTDGWFDQLQWEPNFQPIWSWMEQYTSSNVLLYAVLLFGVLFFVQLPWLKKQLEQDLILK